MGKIKIRSNTDCQFENVEVGVDDRDGTTVIDTSKKKKSKTSKKSSFEKELVY